MKLIADQIIANDTKELIYETDKYDNEGWKLNVQVYIPSATISIIQDRVQGRDCKYTFAELEKAIYKMTGFIEGVAPMCGYSIVEWDTRAHEDLFNDYIIRVKGYNNRRKTYWIKIGNLILNLRVLSNLDKVYSYYELGAYDKASYFTIHRVFVIDAIALNKINMLNKNDFTEVECRKLAKMKSTKEIL